jgi:hypothetical protein
VFALGATHSLLAQVAKGRLRRDFQDKDLLVVVPLGADCGFTGLAVKPHKFSCCDATSPTNLNAVPTAQNLQRSVKLKLNDCLTMFY